MVFLLPRPTTPLTEKEKIELISTYPVLTFPFDETKIPPYLCAFLDFVGIDLVEEFQYSLLSLLRADEKSFKLFINKKPEFIDRILMNSSQIELKYILDLCQDLELRKMLHDRISSIPELAKFVAILPPPACAAGDEEKINSLLTNSPIDIHSGISGHLEELS